MFNQKLLETSGTLAKTLCVLSLTVACAPAWSDAEEPEAEQVRYEMAVFSDVAHGTKVLSGKYDQAITNIRSNSRSADEVYVQTNLCVAYVKSGDIDAAEKACEEAVLAAKSLGDTALSSFIGGTTAQRHARYLAHGRYLAIALSNRGVMRAVSGDLEAARKDFDAAMAQNSSVASVKANIERIEKYEETA